MLAAFIEEGHDHVDAVGGGDTGADDPLQILEMIVRGHMVGVSADHVGDAVIHHVHHDVDIGAPHRLIDDCLGLTAAEAGTFAVQQVGIHIVAAVVKVFLAALELLDIISAEAHDVVVHHAGQLLTAFQGGDL